MNPMVELEVTLIDLWRPGHALEIGGVRGVGNVAPRRLPRWSGDSECIAVPMRATYSDAPSTGDDAAWEVRVRTGETRKWAASSALDAELLAALITTDRLNTRRIIEQRPQAIRVEDYTVAGGVRGGAWRSAGKEVLFWNAPALTLISPEGNVMIPGEFASVMPPALGDAVGKTVVIRADGRTSLITTGRGRYGIEDLSTKPGWRLLGIRAKDAAVVYKDDSDSGTFVLLARPGRRARTSSLHFNSYFGDVLRPERRPLVHRFPDGSVRKGVFVLPIDYKDGRRYPVVIWAYPDNTPTIRDSYTKLNSANSVIYPIQYLLTKGFAFFEAPFPIGESSGRDNGEPMDSAVSAVIPWLDVLDRQPEVLPGEYGFFGHSNAGYVALALEALTHCFKAIAAWDTFPEIGFGSLHSWSADVALNCAGNVIQSDRQYNEDPRQPYAPRPSLPWVDPRKYIRNDPLFNMNRASTPLLLVEGEFDLTPDEMEEVYSVLYARGVPVELALYWGESHVFVSPGNIHDSWIRTARFFKGRLRCS